MALVAGIDVTLSQLLGQLSRATGTEASALFREVTRRFGRGLQPVPIVQRARLDSAELFNTPEGSRMFRAGFNVLAGVGVISAGGIWNPGPYTVAVFDFTVGPGGASRDDQIDLFIVSADQGGLAGGGAQSASVGGAGIASKVTVRAGSSGLASTVFRFGRRDICSGAVARWENGGAPVLMLAPGFGVFATTTVVNVPATYDILWGEFQAGQY